MGSPGITVALGVGSVLRGSLATLVRAARAAVPDVSRPGAGPDARGQLSSPVSEGFQQPIRALGHHTARHHSEEAAA